MDRLASPGGDPWKRAQTHRSLAGYLLEEAYEAYDAIEADDTDALREELGDVLLQVVLHARLAEDLPEGERWNVDDVAGELVDKMVRRNPHVFAGGEARRLEEIVANWERIKRAEKARDVGAGRHRAEPAGAGPGRQDPSTGPPGPAWPCRRPGRRPGRPRGPPRRQPPGPVADGPAGRTRRRGSPPPHRPRLRRRRPRRRTRPRAPPAALTKRSASGRRGRRRKLRDHRGRAESRGGRSGQGMAGVRAARRARSWTPCWRAGRRWPRPPATTGSTTGCRTSPPTPSRPTRAMLREAADALVRDRHRRARRRPSGSTTRCSALGRPGAVRADRDPRARVEPAGHNPGPLLHALLARPYAPGRGAADPPRRAAGAPYRTRWRPPGRRCATARGSTRRRRSASSPVPPR